MTTTTLSVADQEFQRPNGSLIENPILAFFRLGLVTLLFCFGAGLPVTHAQSQLVNGENHPGSITTPGEEVTWTFEAPKGTGIALTIAEVFEGETDPGFVPWIRLRGPDGAELGAGYGALVGIINVAAPLTGTYTVVVADASNGRKALGSYVIRMANSPTAFVIPGNDQGGALTNGANHSGEISLGDLDLWSFEAAKGSSISARIGEVFESEVDPGFLPWIRLFGPDGTQLREGYGQLAGLIDHTAPLTGTYTILVSDGSNGRDAAGHYLLHLANSPGEFVVPEGDHGGELTNGANHPGEIHLGDLDMWSFEAAKGDAISVRIGEVFESEVDPGFLPWIRLYGPDGTQLREGYGPLVGLIDHTAPLTGTYTVLVSDGSNGRDAAGSYLLHLANSPVEFVIPEGDHGGPLENGANHAGKIHLGDLDMWSLEAAKGNTITVSIGEVFESEIDPGFLPWIRLFGPDGVHLREGYGALAGQIDVVAPLTGTYTVLVSDGSNGRDAEGSYLLHVANNPETFVVPETDEGGSLANGGALSGKIHLGDLDLWSFEATQGDQICVSVGEVFESEIDPGFTPWLRLRGPDGTQVGSGYGALAGQVNHTATLTGTYTAVVSDGSNGGDAEGSYRLHLAIAPEKMIIPENDEGGILWNDTTNQGEIHLGDLDIWSFGADEGETITLRVRDTSGDGALVPWMRLYGPGGLVRSAYHATEAEITFEATDSCLYLLVVSDGSSGGDSTGGYELTAIGLPAQGKQLRSRKMASGDLKLCWPSQMGEAVVQYCDIIPSAEWTDLTMSPEDDGLNRMLMIPSREGNRFFQLKQSAP